MAHSKKAQAHADTWWALDVWSNTRGTGDDDESMRKRGDEGEGEGESERGIRGKHYGPSRSGFDTKATEQTQTRCPHRRMAYEFKGGIFRGADFSLFFFFFVFFFEPFSRGMDLQLLGVLCPPTDDGYQKGERGRGDVSCPCCSLSTRLGNK